MPSGTTKDGVCCVRLAVIETFRRAMFIGCENKAARGEHALYNYFRALCNQPGSARGILSIHEVRTSSAMCSFPRVADQFASRLIFQRNTLACAHCCWPFAAPEAPFDICVGKVCRLLRDYTCSAPTRDAEDYIMYWQTAALRVKCRLKSCKALGLSKYINLDLFTNGFNLKILTKAKI